MAILIPILALACLGLAFGIGLAFASKKLEVHVDPRLEKIHGLLPGSNCGACGGAGCFGFAEKILSGEAMIDNCRVASDKAKEDIATVLGRRLKKKEKMVAVLLCNGGTNVKDRFVYEGIRDCAAANLQMGGQKLCTFGCLGWGSCVKVCPFGALRMSPQGIPVVDDAKCKACNKCVLACPKKLFVLAPAEKTVVAACASHDPGKDTRTYCPVGCIGCKLCEKACSFDAIHVNNNCAAIDYGKCTSCRACVSVCLAKTIRIKEAP